MRWSVAHAQSPGVISMLYLAVWLQPLETMHMPATQDSPCLQAMPQAPQLLLSALRSISQPFWVLPSQLAKPIRHERKLQTLLTQTVLAFGRLQLGQVQPPLVQMSPWAQALPQAPQFLASEAMLSSQPLTGLPSQSPKFTLHWPT